MPDTNGASVSRTGMKDAEALEQIDQRITDKSDRPITRSNP